MIAMLKDKNFQYLHILRTINIFFGLLSTLLNSVWFALKVRNVKNTSDKLIAGTSLNSLSHMISYSIKMSSNCDQYYTNAFNCIVHYPHITLFSFAEPLMHLSILMLAFVDLVNVLFYHSYRKVVHKLNASWIITVILMIALSNAAVLWLLSFRRKNILVSLCCYYEDVLGEPMAPYYYGLVATSGYLSAFVCLLTICYFKYDKRKCQDEIFQYQAMRKQAILKQTAIFVAIGVVLQSIPITLMVQMMINNGNQMICHHLWTVSVVGYFVVGAYNLITKNINQ
ncbi:hypothetical protein T10_2282 [Trichinella papuae]|uniref:G-protein coupled receptors family 1 profile domain-containing protein n=1 Tax=Trichinella papuae TaxID=268474 RepID=A0A0V1MQT4_9BILA|nr:hypothetical protein T10_2282 [Trichinella papuae]